jgi:hypothetical protein
MRYAKQQNEMTGVEGYQKSLGLGIKVKDVPLSSQKKRDYKSE